MKSVGKKVRLVKKPKTTFFKQQEPYSRDKIKQDRPAELAADKYYSYDSSQATKKPSNSKIKRRLKKNKNV